MGNYHELNHTCHACGQVIDEKQKKKKTQKEVYKKCVMEICLVFTVMSCIYLFIFVSILIHSLFINIDEYMDGSDGNGSWDGLIDDGSWVDNKKRILKLIDCDDTEFGCCENSYIEKINREGLNCLSMDGHHNEKILLIIIFIILCICGRIVER